MVGLPGTPQTNASGYYQGVVPHGWSGTYYPDHDCYEFSPFRADWDNVTGNCDWIDFTATGYTYISGHVTYRGVGLEDVLMDGLPEVTYTDGSGYYKCDVPCGWSGTVTPTADCYTFTETSTTYSNMEAKQVDQNYTAWPKTVNISGRIEDEYGSPIDNAIIGGVSGTSTDINGDYDVDVVCGWSGTLVPVKGADYTFDPIEYTYDEIVQDQLNQDFTGYGPGLPQIISTNPVNAGADFDYDRHILAYANQTIDELTVDNSSFKVHSPVRGLLDGGTRVGGLFWPDSRLDFQLSDDLLAGELINVTLTEDIKSTGGDNLENSKSWYFISEVASSSGLLDDQVFYSLASEQPQAATVADLNNDGYPELIAPNIGTDEISVLWNSGDGSGTFTYSEKWSVGNGPYVVRAADFNDDSFIDVATANLYGNDVSILYNNQSGGFMDAVNCPVGLSPFNGLCAADLNGDGFIDFATANSTSGTVSIVLNNGDGTFLAKSDYSCGSYPYDLAYGDFDNDGDFDLVTANLGEGYIRVLLNDGEGGYGSSQTYLTSENSVQIVVTSDFNDDGYLDLAVSFSTENKISGTRKFSGSSSIASCNADSVSLAIRFCNAEGSFLSDLSEPISTRPSSSLKTSSRDFAPCLARCLL